MATYISFICVDCNFKISVSGPHEFKFQFGNMIALPHPVGNQKADGLYINAYCPHCVEYKKLIIVEFIEANYNPWEMNLENIKKEYRENYKDYKKDNPEKTKLPTECFSFSAIKCPTCKNEMIYYPGYIEKFNCPACKNGKLIIDDKSLMIT